ncbi:hypothetical protein M2139_001632 [Enterococcus sp. PF1-24]|uniref:hypothetical protein n=1 Tax=unclassified Enterococcus TaxID=2608891 RepID=UPI002473F54B|nr:MULTISPECIES: hypothetical protein [unclassified Enterococcus]MDH6364645.1 hypothetical protein [Enterococcus sp. PFB1-1]MDH6401746.1 hypothetical protein [Enterococcus sp. PF1-24]
MLSCDPYPVYRKYLQFNELVIDNFDTLVSADRSINYKTNTISYSHGHGSYAVRKRQQHFLEEQALSMTLRFDYQKISRDQRQFYKDFILKNLSAAGRLWAIDGNQLLWTMAEVNQLGDIYANEPWIWEIDVDFTLTEGIWHKADVHKTFLRPYDSCDFIDCLDYREIDECLDCCIACNSKPAEHCKKCFCECENLSREWSLCELKKEIIADFYAGCNNTYQIIYNCEAGKHLWKEEILLGHRLCKKTKCRQLIAGEFYSGTVINSDKVQVTLIGKFENPTIKINGNGMQVSGCFCGRLTIMSTGDIWYQRDSNCPPMRVPVNDLIIPKGSSFGYEVHQGLNQVVVDTRNKCDMVCVFVKVDELTA